MAERPETSVVVRADKMNEASARATLQIQMILNGMPMLHMEE
jgi:hypothetical protein